MTTNISIQSIRKDNLTKAINQEIILKTNLIKGLEAVKAILPQFDGRVLNVRLASAIRESSSVENLHYSVNNGSVTISDNHNNRFSNSSCTVSYIGGNHIKVSVVFNGNRIDATRTIDLIDKKIAEYSNDISECQKDLNDFDAEYQEWLTIEQAVKQYEANHSYRLKGDIDMRR